jgi:hypothetical protein
MATVQPADRMVAMLRLDAGGGGGAAAASATNISADTTTIPSSGGGAASDLLHQLGDELVPRASRPLFEAFVLALVAEDVSSTAAYEEAYNRCRKLLKICPRKPQLLCVYRALRLSGKVRQISLHRVQTTNACTEGDAGPPSEQALTCKRGSEPPCVLKASHTPYAGGPCVVAVCRRAALSFSPFASLAAALCAHIA